ncbi:MAG TPA: amidohydrolase family protein [Gemmatimonadota bacterium]|nr:amidohydrolase family protein [Gemmatimonadota bacterium]
MRTVPRGRSRTIPLAFLLVAMVDLGMRSVEALRTATVHAADLLGVDDRGRIEAGLLADLIAVRGNPLQDIRTMEGVVFVMKGGRIWTTRRRCSTAWSRRPRPEPLLASA